MKINEVEKLIGVTKKNIRFYESVGLLSPGRDKENGYRNYGEEDVKRLEQIKFLRKLGMPIDEIRSMQAGSITLADSMRRHLITLQREQQNIIHSIDFCESLREEDIPLCDFDVHSALSKMEEMENRGTSFKDIRAHDVKSIRYVGAVIPSFVMIVMMGFIFFLMLWAFMENPEDAPPLPIFIFLMGLPSAVILGVIFSLIQRIKEIKKGEIDDAKRF